MKTDRNTQRHWFTEWVVVLLLVVLLLLLSVVLLLVAAGGGGGLAPPAAELERLMGYIYIYIFLFIYLFIYIFIHLYIWKLQNHPHPHIPFWSKDKSPYLLRKEQNVQAHFWKLREGHVTTQNLQSDVSVQSPWVANCFPPCVMAFVTEMFICTKPVLHLLWYETAAPPWRARKHCGINPCFDMVQQLNQKKMKAPTVE